MTPNPQTAAEEWVRTVPLDCPHPLEAREVHVCYECAAANLDAYARQQVEASLEEVEKILDSWASNYPEDIFRPVAVGDPNPSSDRIAASMARHLCKEIKKDIAALREGRDAKIS